MTAVFRINNNIEFEESEIGGVVNAVYIDVKSENEIMKYILMEDLSEVKDLYVVIHNAEKVELKSIEIGYKHSIEIKDLDYAITCVCLAFVRKYCYFSRLYEGLDDDECW